jgi:hypothetical protein
VPESDDNLRLEIRHVLFIYIVGYSKLLIEEQKERLRQLTVIVLVNRMVMLFILGASSPPTYGSPASG